MKQHMATSYTTTVNQSPSVVIHTDLHDSGQFNGIKVTFRPTALKDERNRGQLREVLRKMDTPFEDGGGVHKISTLLGM